MTIVIDPTLAGTLATTGTSNNPIIAYNNRFNSGTATTSIGTQVEAATLAGNIGTYNAWIATPASNTAALQVVFSSATALKFVGLAAHNLGTRQASVRVEYSTDSGSSWNDSGAGVVNATDNQAIGFYFTQRSATHWRIRVTGTSSNVQIGIAMLSDVLTLDQRIYQGYAPPLTPNVVDLQTNVSEGANLLGVAAVNRGSRVEASLTLSDGAFIRSAAWLAFQRHFNSGAPFFWAWRPTQYNDLFYAWRPQSVATIAPENSGPRARMAFSMGMRFYDNP